MPLVQGPNGRLIGRGTWNTEEDEALKAAVKIHGTKSWAVVSTVRVLYQTNHCQGRGPVRITLRSAAAVGPPQRVPGRTGKQCRERWTSKVRETRAFAGVVPSSAPTASRRRD